MNKCNSRQFSNNSRVKNVFTFRPSQRGGAMLTLRADLLPHHGVFPLNKDQHYDKRYCRLSVHQHA